MNTDGVISVISFKDIEERVFAKLPYEEVFNIFIIIRLSKEIKNHMRKKCSKFQKKKILLE
jgi:hypothetical protein